MRTAWLLAAALSLPAADLKLGIVGTDTSHCLQFSRILNDPAQAEHVPGAKIIAAFKGGSRDIESSWSRVDRHAEELRAKYGIEIVADLPTLCRKVDAVLVQSADGRVHLEQVRQILPFKKPFFVDKPLASTLEDAREIARLAREAGVPWFSSSALRFNELATAMKFPDLRALFVWGPGPTEPHHYLDLAWYGIHPIEMMYTLMGTGCEEVTRIASAEMDEVVGRWKDGRTATVHIMRPSGPYGAVAFRQKSVEQSPAKVPFSYRPLVQEIVKFFETGAPPVPPEETLEIFAFLDAAQKSKERGGTPVRLR
jgi:hypothetical protein